MAHGLIAAAAILHDHPDQALAVLQKRFPQMDAQILKSSIAIVAAATPALPAVTARQLENSERFNVAAGVVKPGQAVKSFAGLYTDEFVR